MSDLTFVKIYSEAVCLVFTLCYSRCLPGIIYPTVEVFSKDRPSCSPALFSEE